MFLIPKINSNSIVITNLKPQTNVRTTRGTRLKADHIGCIK